MSQENVELVRRGMEAFNAGGIAAVKPYWSPEVVWHTDPFVPEPGVYEGMEAVVAYLEGFLQAFGAWRIEIHELFDLDGDDVLSMTTISGHPLGQTQQDTGLLNWCHINTVRDGKIVRIRSFLDRAKALEAAGLADLSGSDG